MIRRETSAGWLLISQVDHARLAAELAAAWGNESVPGLPLAEWLVPAVRDHDEGWRKWEAAPSVTEEGRPRQFSEIPSEEATAIWRVSIDTCASGPPSSAEGLRRLRRGKGEVTPDDATVLEAVLRHRGSFDAERLTAGLVAEADLSVEQVSACLAKLERCDVIKPLPVVVGGSAYAIDLPSTGGAPLGGVWVSRHFSALAEMAKEHRANEPDEVAAADAFLREQRARQAEWAEAAREFAGDELDRVLDTGFRYVRFFDWISLWLCMAERDEPEEMPLSSSASFLFEPRSHREIAVSPWPFGAEALELSVPAVRITTGPFASDTALGEALADASRANLQWVLLPPAGRNRIARR